MCKARAVESPGYSLSSKIEELNTQSRSKRSNYDYGNESKGPTSQKYVERFSNINQDYEEANNDDNIIDDQPFIFSLPPDDDDTFSTYSLLGGNIIQKSPLTEFDIAASEGGDQIDLLMNAYQGPNVRGNNMNSIPMSDVTTSMGVNYSPHMNNLYVISKDDNSSGFYQSGNFPSGSYPNRPQADVYYTTGPQTNYNYQGYVQKQYSEHNPRANAHQSRGNGQNSRGNEQSRGRQLSSNAIAGKMLTSNTHGTQRSFGEK